jgi:hypothetical protein
MRMGFGIAAGFVLFLLVVMAVLAIAYSVTNSNLTWPLAKRASVFAGTGPADSSAMPLGGAYTIEWAAQPTSPTACRINATLRSQADPSSHRTLVESFVSEAREPVKVTGFNIPARSDYFVRVESDCSWSFRFVEE